jgi:hypothetical protein
MKKWLKLLNPPLVLIGFVPFIIGLGALHSNNRKCDFLIEAQIQERAITLPPSLSEEAKQGMLQARENRLAFIDSSLEEVCGNTPGMISSVLIVLGFILSYNGFMIDLRKITSESTSKKES